MAKRKKSSPLDELVYLEVPTSFLQNIQLSQASCHLTENHFRLAPDILLPVQLPDGVTNAKDFDVSALTKEMILAGMLVTFAHDKENKHIAYYRELCLQLRPTIKEEMLAGIAIKIHNGDYEIAENLIKSLVGLKEDDPDILLMLAYLYEKKAKTNTAYTKKTTELYNALICMEPPYPAVFFNAAVFFMGLRDWTKAKDLLETYIALKIDDEAETERLEKAQSSLNYVNSRLLLGASFKKAVQCIEEGKIDEAFPLIHSFLQEHEQNWNGWFLLGWALRLQKRWADGIASLKKSLELYNKTRCSYSSLQSECKAEYSNICNELSLCLIEEGKINEASSILENAVAKDCENVKLICNLGILALKKKDIAKASSYFRTALYIDPSDKISKTMLEQCLGTA